MLSDISSNFEKVTRTLWLSSITRSYYYFGSSNPGYLGVLPHVGGDCDRFDAFKATYQSLLFISNTLPDNGVMLKRRTTGSGLCFVFGPSVVSRKLG
jgi:hypothetical protein